MAREYSCDICGAILITPIPVQVTEQHPHDGDELPRQIDACTPCAAASNLQSPLSLDELRRRRNQPATPAPSC